ncbi:hypothetical protein JTB14_000861 [Gonioctena quinquepunctata]|nr:hypothetical protein JTB14_000861 [Gonioctena quinquepunctata]
MRKVRADQNKSRIYPPEKKRIEEIEFEKRNKEIRKLDVKDRRLNKNNARKVHKPTPGLSSMKYKEIRQVERDIYSSSDTESNNGINLDNDSDDNILQGDFVLVVFSSENAANNYICLVTRIVSEDELELKYLKRKD